MDRTLEGAPKAGRHPNIPAGLLVEPIHDGEKWLYNGAEIDESIARDRLYASRFWKKYGDEAEFCAQVAASINEAIAFGSHAELPVAQVDGAELTEDQKEYMSGIRMLARIQGIDVGTFQRINQERVRLDLNLPKDEVVIASLTGIPCQDDNGDWWYLGKVVSEDNIPDLTYSAKYWQAAASRLMEGDGIEKALKLKIKVMVDEIINRAADNGQIGAFINPTGLDDKDKQILSAFRVLADRLGYTVGQFTANRSEGTSSAPISRKVPD